MFKNDSMLTNNLNNQPELKNKGFMIINDLFKINGWTLCKNELNWISYIKFGDESTSFDIKITPDKVIVSIPIKNSSYQYVTTFKNYCDASEYIEKRFYDYNN